MGCIFRVISRTREIRAVSPVLASWIMEVYIELVDWRIAKMPEMKIKIAKLTWIILFLGLAYGDCGVLALPMGEKEIAHFEREVLKTVREIFRQKGEWNGDNLAIHLSDKAIREVKVKKAEIVFEGIPTTSRDLFLHGDFDFEKFREIKGISVEGTLEKADIQGFIDRELARQKSEKKIISQANISFGKGKVTAAGLVDLTKIPGNPLAFFPQSLSPFQASFSISKSGSQLMIDIAEAQVNGQPMTPELRTTVLNWLNPLWDFSKLPYASDLEELDISSDGLSFKGFLFSH